MNFMDPTHTQDAQCDVTGVLYCGVVVDFALIQALQVEAGSEDSQGKVSIDKITDVPAIALLYI